MGFHGNISFIYIYICADKLLGWGLRAGSCILGNISCIFRKFSVFLGSFLYFWEVSCIFGKFVFLGSRGSKI